MCDSRDLTLHALCKDEAELSDSAEPQFPVCSSSERNQPVPGGSMRQATL
jgi:hypothetical protein